MSWFASAAVAIAVVHPGHLVRPGLVPSLLHEIGVEIGSVHHVDAARVARIGVEHGTGCVLVEHADARQLSHRTLCRVVVVGGLLRQILRRERDVIVEVEIVAGRRHPCERSFAISIASWSCGLFAINSKRIVDSAQQSRINVCYFPLWFFFGTCARSARSVRGVPPRKSLPIDLARSLLRHVPWPHQPSATAAARLSRHTELRRPASRLESPSSARACARSARAVRAHDSLATSRVGNGVMLALDQHAPFEPMTAWPPAASATAAACARSASPHELHWIVRHFDSISIAARAALDRSPFRSLLGHVASLLLIANGWLILLNNPESTFAIFLCGSFFGTCARSARAVRAHVCSCLRSISTRRSSP